MKQKQVYVLDLTKIDGSGDFPCPRCGTVISPDDCTEEVYSILEPKVDSHGLEELVIRCNLCKSTPLNWLFSPAKAAGDRRREN